MPALGSISPSGERQILAAIMENTRALLAYLDPQFNFVLANSAYVAASGHTWEEMAGRNHFDLFPSDENRAIFEHVLRTGEQASYTSKPFEYANQPERGVTYWDWTLTPVRNADGAIQGLVFSLVDVTASVRRAQEQEAARAELEQLRAEAERHRAELTGLLEISRDVASSLRFEDVLSQIMDHLRPILRPRGAGIFLDQGREVSVLLLQGDDPHQQPRWFTPQLREIPLYAEVIRRRQTTVLDDLEGDDPLAVLYRSHSGGAFRLSLAGSRAWLGIPLMVNDRVVGMLSLDHAEPGYFTPRLIRLAQSIADHAAIAVENIRLYHEAQRAAAFEERQRLARELHDSISQSLYGIALGTHSARKLLTDNPARVPSALDYVLSLAESAVAEMRALIFELRPESLEREGLSGALVHQIAAANARYRYVVHQELDDEGELPADSQYAMYRIAQEAMTNAGRHGRPNQVTVRLRSLPESVVLEVIDDGSGFDPSTSFPGHIGLRSMHERAAAIGAKLDVLSAPGCGTTVRVQAPRALPE